MLKNHDDDIDLSSKFEDIESSNFTIDKPSYEKVHTLQWTPSGVFLSENYGCSKIDVYRYNTNMTKKEICAELISYLKNFIDSPITFKKSNLKFIEENGLKGACIVSILDTL